MSMRLARPMGVRSTGLCAFSAAEPLSLAAHGSTLLDGKGRVVPENARRGRVPRLPGRSGETISVRDIGRPFRTSSQKRERPVYHLTLQICVMLAAALAGGRLMQRLGYPAVLGELAGGILIGPTGLGMLFPGAYSWLLPTEVCAHMGPEALVRIGMLFFMFVAGLEVDLLGVRRRTSSILLSCGLGFIFPFCLGVAASILVPSVVGDGGSGGIRLALFVGTALSVSALPVIARILMDLRLTSHEISGVVMTSATISDVLAWSVFSVLLGAETAGRSSGSFLGPIAAIVGLGLVLFAVGKWIWPPVFRWVGRALVWPGGFLGATSVAILGSAALAEGIGIDGVVGAYLAGVVLGQEKSMRADNRTFASISHFASSFFAPLYFVSIGLRLDFAAHFDLTLVAAVILLATIGKVGGATVGARLGGMRPRDSWAVGWALNARGAVEIVFASTALRHGVITERLFVALVTMAVVTSMVSAPVLRRLCRVPAAPRGEPAPQREASGDRG